MNPQERNAKSPTSEPEGADAIAVATPPTEQELVAEELLVEDVSIDGMCGVY